MTQIIIIRVIYLQKKKKILYNIVKIRDVFFLFGLFAKNKKILYNIVKIRDVFFLFGICFI